LAGKLRKELKNDEKDSFGQGLNIADAPLPLENLRPAPGSRGMAGKESTCPARQISPQTVRIQRGHNRKVSFGEGITISKHKKERKV